MRAGTAALSLLSVPLNVRILTALHQGQLPLNDLHPAIDSPPPTTLRAYLRKLTKLGVLERRQEPGFPGAVDYRLTRAGADLVELAEVADRWLAAAPNGPWSLRDGSGKSALKALVEGWSTAIVRALAAQPLALTDLSRLIQSLSYPSLERRLTAMKVTGQIVACPGRARGTPYAVTEWLRQGAAPLVAAARWERRHAAQVASPFAPMDAEAFFLLALPLIQIDPEVSGSCRLAVDFGGSNGSHRVVGAIATVRNGRLVSCVSRLGEDAEAWVSGSVSAWLDTLVAEDAQRIEIGGDCRLATELLEALQTRLLSSSRLSRQAEPVPLLNARQ